MNEWTNERMNEWMNEWMNERTYECWTKENAAWMSVQMNKINEWTNEQINEYKNRLMNIKWMSTFNYVQMNKLFN